MTRSPIELFWTAKNAPDISISLKSISMMHLEERSRVQYSYKKYMRHERNTFDKIRKILAFGREEGASKAPIQLKRSLIDS